MIKNVGATDHNEYRIEFVNENVTFPKDANGNTIFQKVEEAQG